MLLAAQCLTELRQFQNVPQLPQVRQELTQLYEFGIGATPREQGDEFRLVEAVARYEFVRRYRLTVMSLVGLQVALAGGVDAARTTALSIAETARTWQSRLAAVQELARGWPSDPNTLRILKSLAETDQNEYVRQAAVQELARGWPDDPDTLHILKERAETDPNDYVRQSAVQALARGWPNDPDTLHILKERAETDPNDYVRQSAVQELARGWPNNPDTLRILKERAKADQNGAVRQAAAQFLTTLKGLS